MAESSTASSASSLSAEIAQYTQKLNNLKLVKDVDNTAEVEETKNRLAELKKRLGEINKAKALAAVAGTSKSAGASDAKKRERLLLKTAKGTRDYGPAENSLREHIEDVVKECFKRFGGSCIDTPVFERKDILTGKYGEDSKLIFDLKDQGGEELSLRYDHTVPLARFLAMGISNFPGGKLWQVGKVYRRDNPVVSKGRMREFSQADFDIAGVYDSMIPDAEILSLLADILTRLRIGEFTIKLNHRKILDGIFAVCGVPEEKTRSISSAVDKLDKMPWVEVKKEMTEEKGLDAEIADKIGEYVKHKGGCELLDTLKADTTFMANKMAAEGVKEMGILFSYLEAYNVLPHISFDLSLARGLDYYTGIIYEAIVEASAPPGFVANPAVPPESTSVPAAEPPKPKKAKKKAVEGEEEEVDEASVGVGSIAAGGRYDNLVGMFTAAAQAEGKKAPQMPCVGVSIGMDRIFALLWPKWSEVERTKGTHVFVMAAGDGLIVERMKLVRELRSQGIKTDFLLKNKPKLPAQFSASEKDEVPFAIILGENEIKEGFVVVKEQVWDITEHGTKEKRKDEGTGTKIKRDELVDWLVAKGVMSM
ncbi:Cytoplasmic and mitochondrial histidine tRNA synthetase [Serendipita sp. 396]|nr:Cytoplasmic and mitochondrial histidine tRNA synthetase [Serendipita sp. 396]KAG8780117.1 Cytoplasmic and mitochondrial histidine tRNA synthetase [Serendipita sp. 397]KAG8797023.1 Cytoplasmic and mitochondrial histidine tRNA synthetase [Serendipita sp. 398]